MTTLKELRLVVTADDCEAALHFYRDILGLTEQGAFTAEGGHGTILEAGRATPELTDRRHAEYIDKIEVGQRLPATSGSRSRWTTAPPPRPSCSAPARACWPRRRSRHETRSTPGSRRRPRCS